ncbi:SDR family NAD(P)-dependent oxidoreductase [Schumannella sp. 10F1B-5-1]|nr:SDR family NAD(P)-dependent oxidoreductase [Schumannella sp. 10F1B-5-1]
MVVTGASSGIGEATARRFAASGWEVVGVARRADRLEALRAEIGLIPIVADLTSDADLARAADEIAALGPLDALVNNAGGAFGLDPVETGDAADWRAMFEINVIAVKQLIGALLPSLRAGAAEHGNADILTITSIAAQVPYEGGGGYNAAKFAAHALMGALRLELSGEPLRVIEIAPGMVKTDFSLVRFAGDQERADAVYQGVENPLSADDIAEAIVHAIELPGHVNLDVVTIKPVAQAAPHKVARGPLTPKA